MFFFSCSITWAGYIKPAAEEEESSQEAGGKERIQVWLQHNQADAKKKWLKQHWVTIDEICLLTWPLHPMIAPQLIICQSPQKPYHILPDLHRHLFCIVEMLQKQLCTSIVCIRTRSPVSHNLKMLMRKRRNDIEASKLARDNWEIYVTNDICRR